jgi:hypothetical protein
VVGGDALERLALPDADLPVSQEPQTHADPEMPGRQP